MKFPDIFGIIVCWIVRKRMKWFPRWKKYFALNEQAYSAYAEFVKVATDYTSRASTISRSDITPDQLAHCQRLHTEAMNLWAAADHLMHAPDMHHITTGEEPA